MKNALDCFPFLSSFFFSYLSLSWLHKHFNLGMAVLICLTLLFPPVWSLNFLTWDSCYFHYLVQIPASVSSKSVITPSEAGSQDSGDLGQLTW